jgi:predicted small integral membrane protein
MPDKDKNVKDYISKFLFISHILSAVSHRHEQYRVITESLFWICIISIVVITTSIISIHCQVLYIHNTVLPAYLFSLYKCRLSYFLKCCSTYCIQVNFPHVVVYFNGNLCNIQNSDDGAYTSLPSSYECI